MQDHHDISYTYTMLVLVQVLCSCFAGVYNERLLKSEGHDVHIMVQNTFMYLDSILANILFLCFNQSLFEVCCTITVGSQYTFESWFGTLGIGHLVEEHLVKELVSDREEARASENSKLRA